MTMTWSKHRQILMKDLEFRKVWEARSVEREIARSLVKARIDKKMTQSQLARKMKTKQSVISRVENAQTKPTLSFLERLAVALDGKLEVNLRV